MNEEESRLVRAEGSINVALDERGVAWVVVEHPDEDGQMHELVLDPEGAVALAHSLITAGRAAIAVQSEQN